MSKIFDEIENMMQNELLDLLIAVVDEIDDRESESGWNDEAYKMSKRLHELANQYVAANDERDIF